MILHVDPGCTESRRQVISTIFLKKIVQPQVRGGRLTTSGSDVVLVLLLQVPPPRSVISTDGSSPCFGAATGRCKECINRAL